MIHIGEVYKIGEFRSLKKSPRGEDQIMAGRKIRPSAELSRDFFYSIRSWLIYKLLSEAFT